MFFLVYVDTTVREHPLTLEFLCLVVLLNRLVQRLKSIHESSIRARNTRTSVRLLNVNPVIAVYRWIWMGLFQYAVPKCIVLSQDNTQNMEANVRLCG